MASESANSIVDIVHERLEHKPEPVSSIWPKTLKALCVDDNTDAAETLAAVLEVLGCETRFCFTGADAVEQFEDFHPDVCFLDLMMPKMDGFEAAVRIRALVRSRPLFLVAVTAQGSLEYRTQTAVTGFHYHLVKPVDATTLALLINDIRTMLSHRPA